MVMNKERAKFRRSSENLSYQLNNNEELVNFVSRRRILEVRMGEIPGYE